MSDKDSKGDGISVKDQLPEMDVDVSVSYDEGKTFECEAKYTDERLCMMAGIAGGYGYFGEGWAVADSSGADSNLILDEPTHWKYLPSPPTKDQTEKGNK